MEAVMPPFLIQCGMRQNLGYGNIITGIVAEGLTGYEARMSFAGCSENA